MNFRYAPFILMLSSCITPVSSVQSLQQGLSSGDSVTCTATTQCVCSVNSGPSSLPSDSGTTTPDFGLGWTLDSGTLALDSGTSTPQDAGAPYVDAGVPTAFAWSLQTSGNRILLPSGQAAQLRGANAFDTRMCGACSNENWPEVRRKLDIAVSEWGMNFIRLNLENASTANDAYFQGLLQVVTGMRQRWPDVYIMVAIWSDDQALTSAPNGNPNGAPNGSPAYTALLSKLTVLLRDEPNVLFGCSNEPRSQPDATVYVSMKHCVDTVRALENPNQRHIVVVQGTQSWGRTLSYYVGRELGPDVAYEGHYYDAQSYWQAQLEAAASLPRIVGEFGTGSQMTQASVDALMKYAEANGIPWLAWSFSRLCSPDMISPDSSNSRCAAGTWLPSVYGNTAKARLAKSWGSP